MDRHEWKGADGVARFASKTHAPIFYDQRVTDELRGVLESVNDEILRLASDLKAKDSENVSLRQRVQELEAMQTGAIEAVDEYIQKLHDDCTGDPDKDERIIGACHARSKLFRGEEAARKALGGKP